MSLELSDEDLTKYRDIARAARQEAHLLCSEQEGWSCAAREEAGDLVLEWREAHTGLVRGDGEGGAQAGANIVTSMNQNRYTQTEKINLDLFFGKKYCQSNVHNIHPCVSGGLEMLETDLCAGGGGGGGDQSADGLRQGGHLEPGPDQDPGVGQAR